MVIYARQGENTTAVSLMSGVQQQISKLSAGEQKRLGLPEDFKTYGIAPFGSVNQIDARTAMEDNEFFWLENFLLTGKGNLRSLWDKGPALYTASGGLTIVYFYWFNIGIDVYCAVFLSDGTAIQVAFPDGATTAISSTPGTFYSSSTPTQLPVACQSGSGYLLIGNNITANAYWIWDGSVLYGAGTVGPFQIGDITAGGSGYSYPPTVSFSGGAGSGVTATAQIANGSVVSVTINNPGSGFVPSDSQIEMTFSGGGANSSALLVASLASTTVSAIEVTVGGTGYTSTPTVSLTGGGGSSAAGTAVVTGTSVTSVTLTNAGSGYSTSPTVSFSGGGGSGAEAVAVLTPTGVGAVTVSSGGSGYTTAPTLTFFGGGGTGATATATVSGGAITSVSVTAAGTLYASPPAIQIQTDINNSAYGNIAVMPFGISGNSIEDFQSRVWISYPYQAGGQPTGGLFSVSAPDSLTDFAPADGGLLYVATDRFLRTQYVALHQSNGYLYTINDSSVDVISNVQTSGSPLATTFNYQNTSPQIGARWRDTVQDFGQAVLFANPNGINGLYGGAVQRISKKLNNLFANIIVSPTPGAVLPTAAVANIYTIPVYLLNVTIEDPLTQTFRTVMLGWDEKNWFIASQSSTMTFINTQEIYSVMTAWGTDGTGLYQLFQTPSTSIAKVIATKAFASDKPYLVNELLAIYIRATDNSQGQGGIGMDATSEGFGLAVQLGRSESGLESVSYPNPLPPVFSANSPTQPVWAAQAPGVPGTALMLTLSSPSPDFTISDVTIAYRPIAATFG